MLKMGPKELTKVLRRGSQTDEELLLLAEGTGFPEQELVEMKDFFKELSACDSIVI